ncbi:hypothetical protein [Duganella sp. CF517]|uniref:hypothetical protein n=1 Tax=Duganella sp. CF517 TaxID=1881038 RepID=UPI001160621E|nr:hypothetical protein [Duganella sp. CF517]
MKNDQSTVTTQPEMRKNSDTTHQVEQALNIARLEGIGPALDFMQQAGVDRQVAVRVLTGPGFRRKSLLR